MAQTKSSWNQVTPLSKFLAMALFILLPFIGFYCGMQYQRMITPAYPSAQDMILQPEPPMSQTKVEGSLCGGAEGQLCPGDYTCRLKTAEANAIGTCIKDKGMETGSSAGYVSL